MYWTVALVQSPAMDLSISLPSRHSLEELLTPGGCCHFQQRPPCNLSVPGSSDPTDWTRSLPCAATISLREREGDVSSLSAMCPILWTIISS